MAKIRQARRCKARSSRTGQPCKAFAIIGGATCRAHGGAAPAVRQAAVTTHIAERFEAGFRASWAAHAERLHAWQIKQIEVTAELLDIAPDDVREVDIARCRYLHGRPDPLSAAPVFRWDERYRVPYGRR